MAQVTQVRVRQAPKGAAHREKMKDGKFRPEIEGLRAIAVLFVLIWHAGVTQLPGGFVGVDVFFVISGFLMTGILYRELKKSWKIDVSGFYRRRIRRLLPASGLVLLVTAFLSWLILPASRIYSVMIDIMAAGFYMVNWRMADTAVDYLAQGQSPSPVQHFWSLSIEEQYYIVWPLLLAGLVILLGKRRKNFAHHFVGPILGTIFIGSLAWSIYLSEAASAKAYFVTTTRLWELALGGLVAVYSVKFAKTPGLLATVLSWLGLVAILASGFFIAPTIPFPGFIALIPTVGCALIILFAPHSSVTGPTALLASRPMVWVGGMSYSLYLWHWPLVVLGGFAITRSVRPLSVLEGVLLTALSFLPAWFSLKFVEDPLRKSGWLQKQPSNTWMLGITATMVSTTLAMSMALIAGKPIGLATTTSPVLSQEAGEEPDAQGPPGANALGQDPTSSPAGRPVDHVASITPRPANAASDIPPVYQKGCHVNADQVEFRRCVFGSETSEKTIALVGDSHAAQWSVPMLNLAKQDRFQLVAASKSACLIGDLTLRNADRTPYAECAEWSRNAEKWLTGPDKPDILVVSYSNYQTAVDGGAGALQAGVASMLARIKSAGVEVVIIRDTPSFGTMNIAECVEANQESLLRCAVPRSEALARRDQTQPAVARSVGARIIDLTDYVCPSAECAPVIGEILVWRDTNHLTARYAGSLTSVLEAELFG
ncbi:MAG: acyltransferase family protein [Propionibacteriaceae bacterium]|nr:acyltransferase family protein [Propionibacteriaceae bacterium]